MGREIWAGGSQGGKMWPGGRKMQNPHRIFSPFDKLIYSSLLVKISDATIDQCNVKFGLATIWFMPALCLNHLHLEEYALILFTLILYVLDSSSLLNPHLFSAPHTFFFVVSFVFSSASKISIHFLLYQFKNHLLQVL